MSTLSEQNVDIYLVDLEGGEQEIARNDVTLKLSVEMGSQINR